MDKRRDGNPALRGKWRDGNLELRGERRVGKPALRGNGGMGISKYAWWGNDGMGIPLGRGRLRPTEGTAGWESRPTEIAKFANRIVTNKEHVTY